MAPVSNTCSRSLQPAADRPYAFPPFAARIAWQAGGLIAILARITWSRAALAILRCMPKAHDLELAFVEPVPDDELRVWNPDLPEIALFDAAALRPDAKAVQETLHALSQV
jgi:hypothetical protein